MFKGFYKGYYKYADERQDEEIYRVRSGNVLSSGAYVPWRWGAPPFQNIDTFTNMEAFQTPSSRPFI